MQVQTAIFFITELTISYHHYWVVILIVLKIKYLDKSFLIIIWHVLSKPMALYAFFGNIHLTGQK